MRSRFRVHERRREWRMRLAVVALVLLVIGAYALLMFHV
jgi:hypothetical protein